MGKRTTDRDIDRAFGEIGGILEPRGFFEDMGKSHTKTIVTAMLTTAKAGIGPGGQNYTPYKPSYQEQINKSGEGASKKWLVGLGRAGQKTRRRKMSGQAGAMLDERNFAIEPPAGDGPAHMTWSDNSGQGVMVYAQVHQGTAHGGKDHTRGQIAARPFMHFENDLNRKALDDAALATARARTANLRNLGGPGTLAKLAK